MAKRLYMLCFPCIGKLTRGKVIKPVVWYVGTEKCSLCKKYTTVTNAGDLGLSVEGQI